MPSPNPMPSLYKRLSIAGVNPAYVRSIALPEWWTDDAADVQAGHLQGVGLIANHLGIPFEVLWDPAASIACPDDALTKFKRTKGVDANDLRWSKCIGQKAAEFAMDATDVPFKGLPLKPKLIRDHILQQGHRWVSLENLLDYLWSCGVPVLHVSEFPKRAKKMDAMAVVAGGRPAIVLAKKHAYSAQALFDTAHELGHIISGHLVSVNALVDSKIRRTLEDKTTDDDGEHIDAEERQANRAAVEILTGDPTRQYRHSQPYISGQQLASACKVAAQQFAVDPAVIAMNVGYGRQFFPTAMKACSILESDQNPAQIVRRTMLSRLHLDRLPSDSGAFLLRVTTGGGDAVPV